MSSTKLAKAKRWLFGSVVAVVVGAGALAPVAASAATTAFYAGPDGTGSACTQASPCSLQTALTDANSDGDTVYLASGLYGFANTATSYTITHAITIAGVPGLNAYGQPNRPEIFSNGSGPIIGINDPSGTVTLRDLTLNDLGSGNALSIASAANVDRVDAQSAGSPCYVSADAVLLQDSVCASQNGFSALSIQENQGSMTVTLRNDTISQADTNYGLYASALFGPLTVNVSNTIIASGNVSISAFASTATASTTINIDHSNYNGSPAALLIGNGSAGPTALNTGAGNQTATPPVFRDAANFDFHEASSSPTINAGSAQVAGGTLGLDGNPRNYGSAPDIGAYQYVPAPSVTTGAAQPGENSAVAGGTVNPNGIDTHYWIFYWPQTTGVPQVQESAPVDAGSGTTGVSGTVNLTGLQPNTTYEYEIGAASGGGVVDNGGMHSFTTTGVPTVTTGVPTSIAETTATVTGTVAPNGLDSSYQVLYGTSPTSLTSTAVGGTAGISGAPETVSIPLTGLQPATTYYYRLVATNTDGVSTNTATQQLSTLVAPTLSSPAVTSITATSASLSATIDPQGSDTTYHFEYRPAGYQGAYSSTAPAVVHAGTAASVTATVAGLTAATDYQWRIVVTHGGAGAATVSLAGTQFRTSDAPPTPTTPAGTTSMSTTTSTGSSSSTPVTGQIGVPATPRSGGSVLLPPRVWSLHVGPESTTRGTEPDLRISYRSSFTGRTRFVLRRVLIGVRRGKRCIGTPGGDRGRDHLCTRLVTVRGGLSHPAQPGANRLTLRSGRLAPGSYVLVATPRNTSGVVGRPDVVRFRVRAARTALHQDKAR